MTPGQILLAALVGAAVSAGLTFAPIDRAGWRIGLASAVGVLVVVAVCVVLVAVEGAPSVRFFPAGPR